MRRGIAAVGHRLVRRVLVASGSGHVLHPGPESEHCEAVGISLRRLHLQRVEPCVAYRVAAVVDRGVLRKRHEGLRHGVSRITRKARERHRHIGGGCAGRSRGLQQQVAQRQVFLIDVIEDWCSAPGASSGCRYRRHPGPGLCVSSRWIPTVQLMIWGRRMAVGRLQVMLWLFWNSGMSCGGRLKFCGKLPVVQL